MSNNATRKPAWVIGEDWASVVAGFLIIALILLASYNIQTPSFAGKAGWGDFNTLLDGLFSSKQANATSATFGLFLVISVIGLILSGKSLKNYFWGFLAIFVLTLIAQIVSSFTGFKNFGLETVLFSLVIGLLISNLFNLPEWLRSALNTELYVKIGLVLLGATILFGDILTAGGYGILQAVVVVFGVWYFAFWIAKKLKVDDEYATMLASAVSICGVSAAIATAGAINGDKKKLSMVVSLVLIVAIPMMIFMPIIAKWIGLSEAVTGAWLGGTIDTTGAVVGAGTIAGEDGLKYATIIKFSQNVLLGVAAFAISIFWAYRNKRGEKRERVSLSILWERFPKFVLGFMLVSLFYSFILSPELTKSSGSLLKSFCNFWFALAFISIGLETRFSDFKAADNKGPVYAFLAAQGFNIILTLVVAYVIFGIIAA
ncbi:YeiH family protein [Xiashengella succiniciproducens]|uniref:YeiH family protein n=1 Tax=Xiashengella succiniciproducens TaxID=2949635 RepID=A0A9J6ZSF3_9BACT|nr:putative sulfate exporter family transporter [Alkaliflexus sp. Ai-910]URW80534.1 YeiH family protein [Alkaliflexus sp. Ai-910]